MSLRSTLHGKPTFRLKIVRFTFFRNRITHIKGYKALTRFIPQPFKSWLLLVPIMCVFSNSDDIWINRALFQWSPVMYSVIDSDFFISSLFFIICIVVLNFWIINLFVAVITNSFAAIRSETRKSAFGATSYDFVFFLF